MSFCLTLQLEQPINLAIAWTDSGWPRTPPSEGLDGSESASCGTVRNACGLRDNGLDSFFMSKFRFFICFKVLIAAGTPTGSSALGKMNETPIKSTDYARLRPPFLDEIRNSHFKNRLRKLGSFIQMNSSSTSDRPIQTR